MSWLGYKGIRIVEDFKRTWQTGIACEQANNIEYYRFGNNALSHHCELFSFPLKYLFHLRLLKSSGPLDAKALESAFKEGNKLGHEDFAVFQKSP